MIDILVVVDGSVWSTHWNSIEHDVLRHGAPSEGVQHRYLVLYYKLDNVITLTVEAVNVHVVCSCLVLVFKLLDVFISQYCLLLLLI